MMLHGLAISMAGALMLSASTAKAQSPAASPEAAKLALYAGHWSASGQSRAGPSKPFTPFSGFETCEWYTGGQALVCRETTKEAAGVSHNSFIMAWDSAQKRYTVHGVDDHGAVITGTGEVEAGRWTWIAAFNTQGDSIPLRFIFTPAAAGARDMTIEAGDGKAGWTKMSEVHYTPLD